MSDLMRFKHCPYCGFSTKQYVEDIGPDGEPTGWVYLVNVTHHLPA